MRLVLDTNVVVSALLWSGNPRQLLRASVKAGVWLFTSGELLAELEDVLSRRKFEKRISRLALSSRQIFAQYARQAIAVQPVSTPRIVRDPDDDVVIGTALAARADLIVTGDSGLLSVGTYQSIRIVTVREAMQIVSQ